jgi:hypothetical protein
MLWRQGSRHEDAVVVGLEADVVDLRHHSPSERATATLRALSSGAPVIVGARLELDDRIGMPDVLMLVDGAYRAGDIKSGSPFAANGLDLKPRRRKMIDAGLLDVRAVIARLEASMGSVGLSRAEVVSILHLEAGGWPMPVVEQWRGMEPWQEARLRDLDEVCRRLDRRFGAEAVLWLRGPNTAVGTTPLAFIRAHHDALRALRDALRREEGRMV